MANEVSGMRVAVLATDGVEQVELTQPVEALRAAGATVAVIAPKPGHIQGMNHDTPGDRLKVDAALATIGPDRFDALVLPGGVANPDTLRVDKAAMDFIRHFTTTGKPVASICHGPWTLIEADAVRGRKMTSWPSLRTDLRNAGAEWVDESVVRDGNFVTSRNPGDLPAFNKAMLELFAQTRPVRAA